MAKTKWITQEVIIIWQGSLEVNPRVLIGSFLVGISPRTVSVETVISCVFFVFGSRQIQNKPGPSAI